MHQIYSMMQTGQDKYGMQTFNQALATLYHKRLITLEMAMQRSSNSDELRDLIEHGAGINTGGNGAPGTSTAPRHATPLALRTGPPHRHAARHKMISECVISDRGLKKLVSF